MHEIEPLKGTPKNMKLYGTDIVKWNFGTIIGVSDSTILVTGIQSVASYEELVHGGKKYKMKDYLKYRSSSDFKKIVKKIKIVK